MSTPMLTRLRRLAREHVRVEHPDLALLARDLGRQIHREGGAISARLAPLAIHVDRPRQWRLTPRRSRGAHVALMGWPGDHVAPLQDPAGQWGLHLVLVGALEVRHFARDDQRLREGGLTWLGPADAFWYDVHEARAHRCRNLSRDHVAWTLLVRQAHAEPRHPRKREGDAIGAHWRARLKPRLSGPLTG